MVLIVIASALVLGIAFYQAIQGTLSALIMAILTVLCSAVALNFYEPMGNALAGRLGAHAQGICLLAMFVLPLLVLREVCDRLIRGNVVLGMWPDRLGGAVFGLIAAMIMVGMLMIVVQLLPCPASIMTYQPYNASLEVEQGLTPRWTSRFALGLTETLSAGAFRPIGGGQEFGVIHGDLLRDAFCLRSRPRGGRAWAPTDALEVIDAYEARAPEDKALAESGLKPQQIERLKAEIKRIQDGTPKYPLISPMLKTKVYVVRVAVDGSARSAKDGWLRLPATHFRLVAKSGKGFYPVAYLTFSGTYRAETVVSKQKKVQITDILVARPWKDVEKPKEVDKRRKTDEKKDVGKRKKVKKRRTLVIDWVYRLPAGEKPDHLVFRRSARVELPEALPGRPAAFDPNDRQEMLALAVKPTPEKVEFPAVSERRLLRPTMMERTQRMESDIRFRVPESGALPELLKGVQVAGRDLKSGVVSGKGSDLYKSLGRSTTTISDFFVPSRAQSLVQVVCEVDPRFDRSLAPAVVGKMTPQLVMDDASPVEHFGAYMTTGSRSKREIYIYYDPASKRLTLEKGFAQALAKGFAKVDKIGFVFLVKADKERGIAGFRLQADPDSEFWATRPMACAKK